MKEKKNILSAADVAECGIFTALMIAGAYIKIPFPFMPLTFQTVFAVSAGLFIGWKKGMISMAVYALMGLIGIPVFTGGGGLQYVVMPSFGYILGFIAAAGVAGIPVRGKYKLLKTVSLALAAFLTDYVFGITYFIAVWQLSGYDGLWEAVLSYNIFYMPKDAVMSVLAGVVATFVAPRLEKLRKRRGGKAEKHPPHEESRSE